MKRSRTVDEYLDRATLWHDELNRLREILQTTGLNEEVKWGAPCYTNNGRNVVAIGAFKAYFGLWFFQGALLADNEQVLVNAQEGKTKAMRQWRMTSARDMKPSIIKRYVKEAVAEIEAGHEIKADRNKPIVIPAELQKAMRRHEGATAGFRKLRRGLQREYADYVASAKRDETRQRRIDKILPMIAAGAGLNDQYRS